MYPSPVFLPFPFPFLCSLSGNTSSQQLTVLWSRTFSGSSPCCLSFASVFTTQVRARSVSGFFCFRRISSNPSQASFGIQSGKKIGNRSCFIGNYSRLNEKQLLVAIRFKLPRGDSACSFPADG